MTRTVSSQFEHFDPEVIEAARDVAHRAGVPLEAWIASVVPQSTMASMSIDKSGMGEPPMAAEPLTGTADGFAETATAPAAEASGSRKAVANDTATPHEGVNTSQAVEGAESSEAVIPGGFTALISRLDGLDRSIEAERRAEQRRLEEIEARIESALRGGPVQQVTERLGDIERRVAQLNDQVAHTRPPGKRGKGAAEEVREAVQEIRQRQQELSGQTPPSETVAPSRHDGPIATMQRDIARRFASETAPVRRPIGLPDYVAEELTREAVRLREALNQFPTAADIGLLEYAVASLAEGIDRAGSEIDLAAVALPVEVIRARAEQLCAEVPGSLHAAVAEDIQHFTGRLEVAAAFEDRTVEGTALHALFTELETIRATVSGLAEPERIEALVAEVQAVSASVTTHAPADEADLRPILDAIRSDEKGSDIGLLASEIHALVAKVDGLKAVAEAEAAARVEAIAAAAAAVADPTELSSIHAMLHSLAEKVDRVGARAGSDGLDALERQVLTLADRIETPHSLDPALSSLERTMIDLMAQVEALRTSSPPEEMIERATRTAVTETLQAVTCNASSGDIGMLRASLADMQARQIASDERLSSTLEGVQTALDRLVSRLGSAEQMASPRAPTLDERLMTSTSVEVPRSARRPISPEVEVPTIANPLAETLLEPGAPRPAVTPVVAAELREAALEPVSTKKADAKSAAPDSDIKTSFIAAARRAAQAAQAELAAEAPLDRHTRARPSVATPSTGAMGAMARLKAGAEQHRRPMLLGLAAVVLTLGAIGLRSGDDAGIPQLAKALEPVSQPSPSGEPPAEPQKLADAAKAADTPKVATAKLESTANQTTSPGKLADATAARATAPSKPSLPQVVGMPALAGDLGNVPPGLDKVKQAALTGDGGAVWDLAVREADGRGMPRDAAMATKLFEKLATAGYAPAQYKLGAHYEKGTGVSRDLAQTKLWYGRAAEQGHARAMHNLGVIFAENPGPSGKPDFVSAATWFRQGAEHGIRDSQYNIAVLYARGLGLTQDLVQSYVWFAAAAAQGDDDAGKKRDDVGTKLSGPDLARAKSLATSFKPRKVDASVNEAPAVQDAGQGPMSLLGAPMPTSTAFTPPGRKAI